MYGAQAPYGSVSYGGQAYPGAAPAPYTGMKPRPRPVNLPTVGALFIVPFLIGIAIFALMSSEVHFWNPNTTALIVGLGAIPAIAFFASALGNTLREGPKSAMWLFILAALSMVGYAAGLAVGHYNYTEHKRPYYEIQILNRYPSVDPANYVGSQLMDAGIVDFAQGTHIDVALSMSFRNQDMYCVAPIISANKSSMEVYDFWAVGMNCCGGHSHHVADYHCGEYNSASARTGLRLMRDDLRPFYRLAVKQAEASHNIHAPHPVFFHFMTDAEFEVEAYNTDGAKTALIFIFVLLAWQIATTIFATLVLLKN